MFCIQKEDVKLELEVVEVNSLFIHEKILPHMVEKLTWEFSNLADLEGPIIIEQNGIILDGNHRAYVFRELKFKYIPVCRIDYFHKNTKLRYWFRLLSNVKEMKLIEDIAKGMGAVFKEVRDRESLARNLEQDRYSFGVQQGQTFVLIRFGGHRVHDAVSAYEMVERVQEKLVQKGAKIDYIPCQHVYDEAFCKALKEKEVIIWTPQITKEMVIWAAREQKVFAPKTTRHLIPARPLNVNIPTQWFKENVSLEEINKRFSSFLKQKEIKQLAPGQVIDGRYYQEELFVFLDKKKSLSQGPRGGRNERERQDNKPLGDRH